MNEPNIVEHEAIKIGDEWYIPMSLILNQAEMTIQQCRQFEPEELDNFEYPSQFPVEYSDTKPYSPGLSSLQCNRFKWSFKPSYQFALVVTALGVDRAKPKDIEIYFPEEYNLTTQMLGSHLQKYKIRITKEFNIKEPEIKNFMVPYEYNKGEVTQVANKWREAGFEGFSEDELHRLLQPGER